MGLNIQIFEETYYLLFDLFFVKLNRLFHFRFLNVLHWGNVIGISNPMSEWVKLFIPPIFVFPICNTSVM